MSERHAQSRKDLGATCGHVCVQIVFSQLHLPAWVQHGSVRFPGVLQRQVSTMPEVLFLATLHDVPVVLQRAVVHLRRNINALKDLMFFMVLSVILQLPHRVSCPSGVVSWKRPLDVPVTDTFVLSSHISFQTSLRLAPRPQSPLAAVRTHRSLFPVPAVMITDPSRVVEIRTRFPAAVHLRFDVVCAYGCLLEGPLRLPDWCLASSS